MGVSTSNVTTEQSNGQEQYNTSNGLTLTSHAQFTSYRHDQPLPDYNSAPNERENSLPTYGELYPEEEYIDEGTERDSATADNLPDENGYNGLDNVAHSTCFSQRQSSRIHVERDEGEGCIETIPVQSQVDDSNNVNQRGALEEVPSNTEGEIGKRYKCVAKRMSKTKKHRKVFDSEIDNLRIIPQDYPPPRPSNTRKADIATSDLYTDPDCKAELVTPESVETVEILLDELTGEFQKEVQRVRAILMWIWYHRSYDLTFRPDKCSPMGYLKRLHSGSISYSELFTFLCRKANIPCVLVDGLAKGKQYEVGKESLTNLTNTWTAVYVTGGWRLVFPLWTLSNEADIGENSTEVMDTDSFVNEFFFLTDPDEFIFRCFPFKTDWQLLQYPYSKEQFKRLPYVSSHYFESYIQLPASQDGTVQASRGYYKINLTLKQGREEDAKLSSVMTFDRDVSNEDLPANIDLNRYVAIIHSNKTRRVNVRLPCNGVFRLKVSDSKRGWLCSVRIVSQKSTVIRNGFPEHPVLDFGPCISTLDAGLVPNSHISGIIKTNVNQELIVTFDITEEILVKTQLFDSKKEVSQYVTHNIYDNELIIRVKVPMSGEYALVIHCQPNHLNKPYTVACNYLLTTENVQTRFRENPVKRKARERLVFVTKKTNNPEVLQQVLNAFQLLNMTDKGELDRATEKLNFLRIKQELTEGMKRKNKQILLNAIVKAKECKSHQEELLPSVTEAEACLSGLSAPSLRHSVLSMGRQTVSEISGYKKPRPLVHDIMKATMILLGESISDVEHWQNIQKYMKRSGKNGFLNKIKRFEISGVTVERAETAYQMIIQYDQVSAISGGSAGVGTFYVWVTDVTERVLGIGSSKCL
ncbi:lim and transglutaminase domain protein ltd-1-like [Ylistrum balloti]|uniref:lim and transglutaminase domain protein ltd-1-like n=1 Tax=Ylistrum balloti TaxID=509963 RepID=UPI002905CD4E|nr:lim and transglutaminase domain protein ltd-1-like [Ylistrum balloti]